MTRIGDVERTTTASATQHLTAEVAASRAGSALALACTTTARGAARPTGSRAPGDATASDRAQQSAAADIAAAFAGSPESFLARIALQLRRSNAAVRETGIHTETSVADTADKLRLAAEKSAARAAEQATGLLGLGHTFDIVAKVAAVVTAVASTVVTGGAAAPVAAGLLLMAFADDLAAVAVKAGVCPEAYKAELAVGLKLTGAVLVTAASLGSGSAAIASVVLDATSEKIVSCAAEAFDMSEEARTALSVTLSVAVCVLAAVAGGASTAGEGITDGALRTSLVAARGVGRTVAASAQVESAAAGAGVAVANHDAAYHRADAQDATSTRDAAFDLAEGHVEGLQAALRAYGRAMKLARQAQEARGQALSAAAQQRA